MAGSPGADGGKHAERLKMLTDDRQLDARIAKSDGVVDRSLREPPGSRVLARLRPRRLLLGTHIAAAYRGPVWHSHKPPAEPEICSKAFSVAIMLYTVVSRRQR